ncbi:MAG: T9SS type A sorting domain-containing protein, partial [Candidatus Desantisbacteria bacterium]
YTITANTPICEMYAIMTEYSVSEGIHTEPNPAKGLTEFVIPLSDNADVRVEVYTLSGDLVWEYSKHNNLAGECHIPPSPWPSTNKAGRKVGTGLYIYKVTIEYASGKKEEVIKKMVVIKQ